MTATMEAATYTVPRDQFWAQGCDRCRFGILYPIPTLRNDRPLYQERLAQYHAGELRPCTCAAARPPPLNWKASPGCGCCSRPSAPTPWPS